MSEEMISGGCQCGDCRFELDATALSACHCHCRSCQRGSGAPYVTWATFPSSSFRVTAGALTQYESSVGVTRQHCARCGTSITYQYAMRKDEIDVTAACLDEPGVVTPTHHIWVEDAPPWSRVSDELPAYERQRDL